MPTQCSRDLFGYEVVEGRQVVAAFDGGDNTSDAGGLLLGATDRAIGLVGRFAACFNDGRAPAQIEHTIEAMVAQRMRFSGTKQPPKAKQPAVPAVVSALLKFDVPLKAAGPDATTRMKAPIRGRVR
jgi:hypothetical protein